MRTVVVLKRMRTKTRLERRIDEAVEPSSFLLESESEGMVDRNQDVKVKVGRREDGGWMTRRRGERKGIQVGRMNVRKV